MMADPETTSPAVEPNVVLSEIIVTALVNEELLVESRSRGAILKIATGVATTTDWGTWAREAIKRKEPPDATETEN